mgnify:CR=1 FL=1
MLYKLLVPADDYQKAMRSAKYALMIIALTFLVFFLVEILGKQRIHPFQYALVGLAITLFYVMLTSISEHSNFNLAYLVSSAVVISLHAVALARSMDSLVALSNVRSSSAMLSSSFHGQNGWVVAS